MAKTDLLDRRCQQTETSFSLDKQLVTPYRTTHTDEQTARSSGVSVQKLDTEATEFEYRDEKGVLTVPGSGNCQAKGGGV